MTQSHYYFDGENRFVIERYNDLAPFASFLPGIAGTQGRPAWAFYVNRGQGIASFGVRNKDGAFLEFFPADKAYQLTASRGFRTFLKIEDGERSIAYEPFQRNPDSDGRQRMLVTPHELGVEEVNSRLGLSIRADMFTLPDAEVAGLVRRVEIANLSDSVRRVEIVDGLPQVQPYAMNQWILKFMSRTSEAFMRVEGVADNRPFYRLRVWPTDSPQVEPVEAGNFFVGFSSGALNRVIVDPERVFGLAGDFSRAEGFFSGEPLKLENQVTGNQTPAALQTLSMELQAGQTQVFYGVYGHAATLSVFEKFVAEAGQSGFFDFKREANRQLVESVTQRAFAASNRPLFDAHARQCYLDNGLRGGFPIVVPGGASLYLYGRKHGDLERDYNDFLLQDTPYSEGNGDFRDVLQNRRIDLFFEPALEDKNIRYFFNLIQPDGYNPCSLRNSRFFVESPQSLSKYFNQFNGLEDLLGREFKYAELWQVLKSAKHPEVILGEVLAQAEEVEDAEFDRGYWSDHWSYLVDLLIGFRAIFPDRLAELFLENTYTFFDPTHFVQPRARKYVVTQSGVRQYDAVRFSADKKALIDSRSRFRYRVRSLHGRGEIVYTTLLGKVLTLVVNKLATLDPAGIGIEMEADRPGWCDALNGLPGILGSSVNETIELKRLADFTLEALAGIDGAVALPRELAEFASGLEALLEDPGLTAEFFWRESGALKESYRHKVFLGFAGERREFGFEDVTRFLNKVSIHLDAAIAKARTSDGIATYFYYEAESYREVGEGRIEVTNFQQKTLPLFLEGFVHALRIADADEARRLYDAVHRSELFDRKLGMYRLNAPLGEHALDLGRIGVFNYGWLENGSIFLHMHYKFVLEMVRAGLVEEFYAEIERLLVAFRDPEEYKRSPVENSSFLVGSGFAVDPRQHGRGCVARLSGASVEFLHLWTHLFLGASPFVSASGRLSFRPQPVLSKSFFCERAQTVNPFGQEESLPADSAALALLGSTLLVYINPTRQDTFGSTAVKPVRFRSYGREGGIVTVEAGALPGPEAEALRQGRFRRLDVELG